MNLSGVTVVLIFLCFAAIFADIEGKSECSEIAKEHTGRIVERSGGKSKQWFKSYFKCGKKAGLDFSDESIAKCTKTCLGKNISGVQAFLENIGSWKANEPKGVAEIICCLTQNNIVKGISEEKQVAAMRACAKEPTK